MYSPLEGRRHFDSGHKGEKKKTETYVRVAESSQEAVKGTNDQLYESKEYGRPLERKPGLWATWSSMTTSSSKHAIGEAGWKPVTLGAPVLLFVALLSVAAITLLEFLSQRSKLPTNGGGLAFANDVDSFTTIQSFMSVNVVRVSWVVVNICTSFLYLPTLLAVLYSILWR